MFGHCRNCGADMDREADLARGGTYIHLCGPGDWALRMAQRIAMESNRELLDQERFYAGLRFKQRLRYGFFVAPIGWIGEDKGTVMVGDLEIPVKGNG